MIARWVVLVTLLAAVAARGAGAVPRVAMLTMTPGPHLFERFGHTALRVDDRVYNFGTFDGDDPHLARKFLARKLPYWLSVGSFADHLRRYDNRLITVQELALTDGEAEALAVRLEENARPENRAYRYGFFLDNCATRVRDAVDRAASGALAKAGRSAPSRTTFRGHVLRVLAGSPLVARGISLLLNAFVDAPITRFEDAFLPGELEALVRDARRQGGAALVSEEWQIPGPRHHPPEPPSRTGELALAALLALLLWGLVAASVDGGRRRGTRIAAGIGLTAWGLFAGALGCVLLVASLTPHPSARANANLLVLSPLFLGFAGYGIALAAGRLRRPALRRMRLLVALLLLACLVDSAGHAAGIARQQHLGLVAAVAATLLLALAATRAVAPALGAKGVS
ncbi:MAG: DUF4105 domain-containing protein [Myxococcales bacterium]|nr:DUF4105 domain-containing protein [Myxococcales bacterium]